MFLSKFLEKNSGNRLLSELVYLRTYSRFVQDKGKESWADIVERVADFSSKLGDTEPGEIEQFKRGILARKIFPAGRTLWIGGTDLSYKNAETNYNCAFLSIRRIEDLHDMQILLMSAAGVGFRITQKCIDQLNLNHPLNPKKPNLKILGRKEDGSFHFVGYDSPFYKKDTQLFRNNKADGKVTATLIIGDSREGWASALLNFLYLLTDYSVDEIIIDPRSVRPKGFKLQTFGGFSSGPEPIVELLEKSLHILYTEPAGIWTSVKVLDIGNLIGRAVVAGGTRRSAEIALGDPFDLQFVKSKIGNWWKDFPWRSQSNNSVIFEEFPGKETLKEYLHYALEYGEPGFVNGSAFKKIRDDWEGLNPCAEIALCSYGTCNLATLNLPAFINEDHSLDVEGINQHLRLITRHAMRITNIPYSTSLKGDWQKIQDRDRLIGISMTGIMDVITICHLSREKVTEIFTHFRKVVHRSAEAYAKQLGIPVPRLMTTVKPEGTLALVAGAVSPGIHYPYSHYFLRRVAFSDIDPIVKVWEEENLPVYDHPFDKNSKIIQLPIKSISSVSANIVPAVKQLENYKLINSIYVDHNASNSIYFSEEEIPQIVDWLTENWDNYRAVSFFPRQSRYDSIIVPYFEIDEISYKENCKKLLPKNVDEFVQKIFYKLQNEVKKNKINIEEKNEEKLPDNEIISKIECNGACPIR